MTNAWLIKNEYYTSARLDQQFAMLTQSFLARGIALTIKTNAEFCFPLGESIVDDMPAFAIMWDKDIILARRLQSFGIRLFNSADAIATCDDKTLMQLAFEKCNLPTPKTIIAPMTYDNIGYTNIDFLSTVAANIGFPLVIKEAKSSYGLGVYKADTLQQAEQILKKISYPIIFQQFVQTSFGRDIRVNVIGDEVVCAVQRLNDHDFRSNVLQGGSMSALPLTPSIVNLALRASASVGCDFCGLDLLYGDNDQLLVCEVNTSAHFGTVFAVTGINLADKIADYITKKIAK